MILKQENVQLLVCTVLYYSTYIRTYTHCEYHFQLDCYIVAMYYMYVCMVHITKSYMPVLAT